ncbi:MAG: TonB-dependent receptor [Oscillospiraceae bacterium]|nr:TonB-dependent receptor [Oscillospiraceae bacterium]
MSNFKKTAKKIGAGVLAGLCAISMFGTLPVIPVEAESMTTENPAFPSSDVLIAQAATLLGTKYGFGKKGYSGIYYQGSYKPLEESTIRSQGIDCSGLIYYSLTHLGYSTTGFDWNNPVPVDTEHWLTVNADCTITYGDVTSIIDIEKERIKTTERPYWECADGSTIAPGSVVVAEIPNDINHSWIYMGEFSNRNEVVNYLKNIGVPDSLITDKTVGDGSGDGGTHWRIESNGQEGVVVNNKTTGKKASALSMYAFRVTQNDVNFTITKVLSTDNSVKICGTSPIDGTQAVYGVYADADCKNKVGEIVIGEDGTGSITLPNATYYVKEISAPTGYDLNPEVFKLDPYASIQVPEDITSGSIRINKTAEDGVIGDREFQLTWTDGGTEHTISAQTDENGVAEFDGLNVYDMTAGTAILYTVSEVNVAERYVTPKAQDIVLTDGDADLTVTADFDNVLKKGSIRINKQSEDFQNGDRHFVVTGNGQTYDITTGSDGIAVLTDIPVFDSSNAKIVYTISEKDVPIRYVVPADDEVTLTADATTDVTFENKLKKFTAEVTKTDAEKTTAQGDATLAGAVYGLYLDGELVDTYTTDENGYFKTSEYPCGNYTVQEITPSAGYLLDATAYPVGAEPENYTLENNQIPMGVTEDVVKGSVSIIKHSDDNENDVVNMEQGAEFEVYLKSAGSYDAAADSVRDYLTTDENGYASTKEMPYGVYTVHQTKTVDDAAFVADFDVQITENHNTYEYVLNNAPFRSYIHVTKLDAETGKTIAYEGAGFQIYDVNGQLVTMGVDTFYTNSEGYLITPETLRYGEYTLVEVQAPIGYVLDATPVPFSVTAANATEENAVNIVRVSKADTAQKGKISVYKHGEIFQTVKSMAPPIAKDKDGNTFVPDYPTTYHPIFEDGGLSGAEFEIVAAEDIVTADGTIRAKKGDVVTKLTTDKNGYAESDLLYLGKYNVSEVNAPYGYVKNDEALTVELAYAGQTVAVRDDMKTSFNNLYQAVKISLKKFMEQDELFGIGMNNEWRSVRFGLFAAEEIKDADGTAIPENGFLAEVSLNKDMSATIAEQIPFGRYYVQEIATDQHYVLNGEKYLVNFVYQGQDVQTVNIDCGTFENHIKRGSVDGKKVDPNGEPLEGALFGLFKAGTEDYSEAAAIMTDISDENGCFAFADIPYGLYTIREIKAPEGYMLSDEVFPVMISETAASIKITAENSPISLAISKENIYGEELPGAQMQLVSEDGSIIDEWISDGTNHVISVIPAGSYTLHEVVAPDGYLVATDIAVSIDEDGVVTVGGVTVDGVTAESHTEDGVPLITMVDDTTLVKVRKTDITTGDELEGASL